LDVNGVVKIGNFGVSHFLEEERKGARGDDERVSWSFSERSSGEDSGIAGGGNIVSTTASGEHTTTNPPRITTTTSTTTNNGEVTATTCC